MRHIRTPDAAERQRWVRFIQAQNPDIDPRAIRLMDEMRRVAHLLYQVNEESLEPTGLSYAQYRILQMLFYAENTAETAGEQCSLNPSEISIMQGIGRNTVSGLIRSLEDTGFIERQLDSEDRRKFNIHLTEAGRQIIMQSSKSHLQTVHNIFSELSADEMETMSLLLKKLDRRAIDLRHQTIGTGGTHASNI